MAGGSYDRSQKKSQLNPAVSYAFALQVEAAFFLPLKSVRVFNKENEFDYYQEGGLNDYVHMLRKPISKPFTFQVERYVGVDAGFLDMNSGFIDPLALGTDLILPLVLYVNRSPSAKWYNNISFENCARAYVFTGCTVTAKEYGELNAEQSKLLTETTTIAYRELITLNQISPDWEKGDVWQMTADSYLGGGEAHDSNRTKGNASKKDQETKGKEGMWEISKDAFDGNKKFHTDERSRKDSDKAAGSAAGKRNKWGYPGAPDSDMSTDHEQNRSKNDPKSDMETKGKEGIWEISKDAFDGNKKFHTDERSRKDTDKAAGSAAGRRNKWGYPGTPDADMSKDHPQNRSNNDPKSAGEGKGNGGKWEIDKDTYDGNKKYHTDERSREDESKKEMEEAGNANKWIYDGSVAGQGKSHEQNRNKNEKPTPVIWPPTRRALRAQELSKL
ncbi:MAG: hypothetical protein K5847_06235 [Lachnospiraceae bacterium]|nr:hypothetical protein [Lachnospiraceae bacterium]